MWHTNDIYIHEYNYVMNTISNHLMPLQKTLNGVKSLSQGHKDKNIHLYMLQFFCLYISTELNIVAVDVWRIFLRLKFLLFKPFFQTISSGAGIETFTENTPTPFHS